MPLLLTSNGLKANIPQVLLTDTQAVLVNGTQAKLVGIGEQITSLVVNIFKLEK